MINGLIFLVIIFFGTLIIKFRRLERDIEAYDKEVERLIYSLKVENKEE